MSEQMIHTAMSRAIPSLPATTERDGQGRMLARYRPAEMRSHALEAMAILWVDLGIADPSLLQTYQKPREFDPRLSEAGLMDLAASVVRVVQAPEAADHFQTKPAELKEAAIRLQLAAEYYVDIAGGKTVHPKRSANRLTISENAMAKAPTLPLQPI
jgi:hypothetical protein